jgi:hypothetical protein
MRTLTAVVALAVAGLLPAAAPTASSARPLITTVKVLKAPGAAGGRIYAAWTLPPGVDFVRTEIATKPNRSADGMFPLQNQVDWDSFDGPRRSWRSEVLLEPGTYYFHVGAEDDEAANPLMQWSKTRTVKIPGEPLRGGAYAGKTSQGYEIRIVTDPRRRVVRQLTTTAVARCAGRSRSYRIRGGGPSIDRVSGRFFGTLRDPQIAVPGGIGSIKGRFDRSSRVTGTISVVYFGLAPVGVTCYETKAGFSARRTG